MLGRIPDYNDLVDLEEAKDSAYRKRLPKCSECGEHIEDDECYEFDGNLICIDCMEENHRVWVESYAE